MTRSLWNKKLPTLLGLGLLIVGVISTSLIVQKGTNLVSKADVSAEPHSITVTNISDTSATISFTTDKKSIATLSVGTGNASENMTFSDIRDINSAPTERTTHYFNLGKLTSNTSYTFTITSGGDEYKGNPDPYQFTTPGTVTFTNTNDHKITGKIRNSAGEVVKDILVTVSSDSIQDVSTFSGLDGAFSIPVQNIRSSDLSQALSLTEDILLSLTATDGTTTSTVVFRFKHASPLPTIILGNTYDFSSVEKSVPFIPKDDEATTFPLSSNSSDPTSPNILTPTDGEKISDTTPSFTGTAKPNETVNIVIGGKENIQAKIVSTQKGKWTYQPTKPLQGGEYSLRISAKNASGISQTTTTNFTITDSTARITPSPTKKIIQ